MRSRPQADGGRRGGETVPGAPPTAASSAIGCPRCRDPPRATIRARRDLAASVAGLGAQWRQGRHLQCCRNRAPPEYLPYIAAALTPMRCGTGISTHLSDGQNAKVERFYLPGISALKLPAPWRAGWRLPPRACASDPLGKSVAQEVLDFPVPGQRRDGAAAGSGGIKRPVRRLPTNNHRRELVT